MEASPMLDDNHSSNKQPDTSGGELVSPAQLPSEATQLQQPSSSPPTSSSQHPHQSQSTPVITEDTPPVEPTMTISKGNELSLSEISTQEQNHLSETNHRESNIKLKRCKHGRIIIKDLSRKKLAQQSDTEANNICVSKEESNINNNNNNHIATANDTHATIANNNNNNDDPSASNHHEKDNHPMSTRIPRNNSHEPSKTELSRVKNLLLPRTPPLISAEKSLSSRELNEKIASKDGPSNKEYQATKSDSWSASSSGSSLSPLPLSKKRSRSPSRQSQKSRSPSTKERSSSRSRRQTSSRRRDSPSPRSRPRSPASSRKRNRRSSGRRRNRTPDRHRYSDNHRYRRRSSWSRSPSRRQPRSRSSSPLDRDRSYRRNRRDDSASPNRDKSRYDRSHKIGFDKKSDTPDKPPRGQSPRGREGSRRDSVESKATDSHKTSQNTTNHKSHPPEARSSNSSRLPTQIKEPSKKSPRSAHAESKSMNVPAARSPQTNSRNDDSASSDIYDPEGPIIPISPGDSPPISPLDDAAFSKGPTHSNNNEKNGEDDVPSSAVQLNQQEKYLQKLNRQERVVEEVKIALKPFYQNRTIGKEQYKEVLRKAVPKICHSKNGEINPIKIRSLVDAYVRKMR